MNLGLWLSTLPAWAFMWGLSLAIYAGLKGLSWSARTVPSLDGPRDPSRRKAPVWKHLGYLFAWPGMDADTFLGDRRSRVRPPELREWMFAAFKLGFGAVLVWIVVPTMAEFDACVIGWTGMVGIVFLLHFGLFHLLSCGWRYAGVAAVPIMNWPIASQSLTEFWGRRWNLAFRDLTHRFLFQPLIGRIGAMPALLLGFFVSGLVHDLVISWPAGGGWGLPTGYFVLQGMGIVVERSRWGRELGLGRGLVGRLYCVLLIGLPSPLLFHPAFLNRVIVPFLAAIGAAT